MAQFTKEQINNGAVYALCKWARGGGWDEVNRDPSLTPWDYLMSPGIYWLLVEIDGDAHNFYSKGAKKYGLENLD